MPVKVVHAVMVGTGKSKGKQKGKMAPVTNGDILIAKAKELMDAGHLSAARECLAMAEVLFMAKWFNYLNHGKA